MTCIPLSSGHILIQYCSPLKVTHIREKEKKIQRAWCGNKDDSEKLKRKWKKDKTNTEKLTVKRNESRQTGIEKKK